VWIETYSWQPSQAIYECVDPLTYGHRNRHGSGGLNKLPEEAKAERREVIENNKAWRAAEPVRRLPLVLLAQVAAAREQSMDVYTWRKTRPEVEARWLAFLAGTGYTLSDIEQTVIDNAAPRTSGPGSRCPPPRSTPAWPARPTGSRRGGRCPRP
jgi:hypothetical protein